MRPRSPVDIVVLRLNRLAHLPPALYAAEQLKSAGFSIKLIEFLTSPLSKKNYPFFHEEIFFSLKFVPTFVKLFVVMCLVLWRLAKDSIVSGRPQLLIANGLPEYLIAFLYSLVFRVPFICHVHELYDEKELSPLNQILWSVSRYSFARASLLIFPEAHRRDFLINRWHLSTPTCIVYNCSPKSKGRSLREVRDNLRKDLAIPETAFMYLYMGGISEESCLEMAIQALVECPEVYLCVAGWGERNYLDKLKELTRAFHVSSRVVWVGAVSNQFDYLLASDASHCLYRPSLLRLKFAATASNKLMESIACKTPPIYSSHLDFREFHEKYPVGVMLENLSSNALSGALTRLQTDAILRKHLKQEAEKAFEVLNFDVQFEKAMGIIKNNVRARGVHKNWLEKVVQRNLEF